MNSLFGLEFARKLKELVDQLKAIGSTTQKGTIFSTGLPKSRGLQPKICLQKQAIQQLEHGISIGLCGEQRKKCLFQ